MTITLPIYYVQEFKTKNDKTIMVGMSWYRSCKVYYLLNQVKQYYHTLVIDQLDSTKIPSQYTLHLDIYYKNPSSDGSNIAAIMEKFTLDALQEHGTVVNDNVKYHLGSTWTIAGQDKDNPRCEITIKEVQ